MKRLFLFITIPAIVFLAAGCDLRSYKLRSECCLECKEAFGGSAMTIGAEAARCIEFSTMTQIGKQCEDYFKNNPTTVSECD